jgi:hypothetical protein
MIYSQRGLLKRCWVERIAVCWWRQKRALQCEAGLIKRSFLTPADFLEEEIKRKLGMRSPAFEAFDAIKGHLSLPLGRDLDRILRYETTIQRQLVYVMNQLERLQRIRKGEHLPATVNVQLSGGE